jgi:hypothetical protein
MVAMVAGSARAADADPRWQFTLAPYAWATAIDAELAADGLEADAEVEFSDVLDAMDAGFLIAFEARQERVSLTANGIYLRLRDDAERATSPLLPIVPPGSLDLGVTMDSAIVEGLGGYEVWSSPLAGGDGWVALDLRLGARYLYVRQKVEVELRRGVPLPTFDRSFDDSSDWIDALVGARVRARLSERLGLVVGGDYGGFGWGSSSDPSWSAQGFLNYQLSPRVGLGVGWRHLEIDRGPLELTVSGPLVGTILRF